MESTGLGTTVSLETVSAPARTQAMPGVVVVFAGSSSASRCYRLGEEPLVFGRSELGVGGGSDPLISRKHVRLTLEASGFRVEDLGSRNGTYVDGQRVGLPVLADVGSVVRVGGAILLLVADTVPFEHYGLGIRAGVVGGPGLRRVLESVERIARAPGKTQNLLVTGETGTGKELAAQAFHSAGDRASGPFTAVNCATIPRELAERLLFGARRGAFSGATDSIGHVQSAHGGTLFLDEIAELPLEVQSKLLRVIETREVQRLGASRSDPVDVRICAATWRDLRAEVGAGRFREDLYFRIGQPELRLPPLRERPDEIAWHVHDALEQASARGERPLVATAGFVEACLLRQWPGNVRELRGEVRRAALAAPPDSHAISAEELSATAGLAIRVGTHAAARTEVDAASAASFPRDEIADAMAHERGNVASAARRLGVHRNKVRRWLERHKVEARYFKFSGRAGE
jgi:transcriptional regulator with AAA-type ATPase domain